MLFFNAALSLLDELPLLLLLCDFDLEIVLRTCIHPYVSSSSSATLAS